MNLENLSQEINSLEHVYSSININFSLVSPGIIKNKSGFGSAFSTWQYLCDDETEAVNRLYVSLIDNHIFNDGNKRSAFQFYLLMLDVLGLEYVGSKRKLLNETIMYLEKKVTREELLLLMKERIQLNMKTDKEKCNLEYIIPRIEYVNGVTNKVLINKRTGISIDQLELGKPFLNTLKKPIFQRDTNDWTIEKVKELIKTFVEGRLIPSIILWEAPNGEVFIIDGAHRLSALISWVNNKFDMDEKENKRVIENLKHDSTVPLYQEALKSSEYSSVLANNEVMIQWVVGEYEIAKASFIKINEQGVTISNEEKEMIKDDQKATVLLARKVLSLENGQMSRIQTNVDEIHQLLFLDDKIYPLIGKDDNFLISRVYTLFKLIADGEDFPLEDLKEKVVKVLRLAINELQIVNRVYFYGATKNYKTNSFYGFMYYLSKCTADEINEFILKREQFERYIVENENNIQIISRRRRQAKKSYKDVKDYFELIINTISNDTVNFNGTQFEYIINDPSLTDRQEKTYKQYLSEIALYKKCSICGAYISNKDHNICSK